MTNLYSRRIFVTQLGGFLGGLLTPQEIWARRITKTDLNLGSDEIGKKHDDYVLASKSTGSIGKFRIYNRIANNSARTVRIDYRAALLIDIVTAKEVVEDEGSNLLFKPISSSLVPGVPDTVEIYTPDGRPITTTTANAYLPEGRIVKWGVEGLPKGVEWVLSQGEKVFRIIKMFRGLRLVSELKPVGTKRFAYTYRVVRSVSSDFRSGTESGAGTAFAVATGERCILATAAHVSWDQEWSALYQFNTPPGKSVTPQRSGVAYSDGASDISFVNLDTAACREAYAFQLTNDPMKEVGVGDEIFVLGHPLIRKGVQSEIPLMRAGLIASTADKRNKEPILTLDLLGVPGFSGSPVILKRTGHAIGVLIETTDVIGRFTGFSRAALIRERDLSQFIGMFPSRIKQLSK